MHVSQSQYCHRNTVMTSLPSWIVSVSRRFQALVYFSVLYFQLLMLVVLQCLSQLVLVLTLTRPVACRQISDRRLDLVRKAVHASRSVFWKFHPRSSQSSFCLAVLAQFLLYASHDHWIWHELFDRQEVLVDHEHCGHSILLVFALMTTGPTLLVAHTGLTVDGPMSADMFWSGDRTLLELEKILMFQMVCFSTPVVTEEGFSFCCFTH